MNQLQITQRTEQRNTAMKNNMLKSIIGGVIGLVLAPAALAAQLQNIDVASLPGDKVEIKLSFDEQVDEPRG